MISEEKIKQVFNAIKENGIMAFPDDDLIKLLSILTPAELDVFEMRSFDVFTNIEDMLRVMNIRPLVDNYIRTEIRRIKNSNIYHMFIESLKNKQYLEYFESLMTEELADLKKYLSYSISGENRIKRTGVNKIIDLLTREIRVRESNKKPHFN